MRIVRIFTILYTLCIGTLLVYSYIISTLHKSSLINVSIYSTYTSFMLMTYIFVHNTLICCLVIVLSLLTRSRLILCILFIYQVSTIAILLYLCGMSAFKTMLVAMLPHGIPELSAVSLTYSICFDMCRQEVEETSILLKRYWKYIVTIFILLVIAAYIETYITPQLIKQYLLQE